MYIGIRNALINLVVEAQVKSARFSARAVGRRCTLGVGDDDTVNIVENSVQAALAQDVAQTALFQLIGGGTPAEGVVLCDYAVPPASVQRADAVNEAWRRMIDRVRIRELITAGEETKQDRWDFAAHVRWLDQCPVGVLLDAHLRFPVDTLRKLAKG